jgi:hypothetical protein
LNGIHTESAITIAAVVGHKRQGETFGTYSAGPSMEQFRACLEEAVRLP